MFETIGGRLGHDRLIEHMIMVAIIVNEIAEFFYAFTNIIRDHRASFDRIGKYTM